MQAIVDDANAQTAVLRNQVIGTQQFDIKRAPTRLFESAMGNMVTDAMRLKYPGVDAAYTNSGGLRQDLLFAPPTAGEQPGEITWGEMFSVLPFGNRTVILTLTGAQLQTAFLNGFTPFCDPAFSGGTGRFPQVSGLKVTFSCNGTTPVVTGMWKTPQGISGPATPIGPADSVRFVTNDFMYGGGDGYTVFQQGTNVLQPGDDLLQVSIDYVTANSPVGPVVEGRIVGPSGRDEGGGGVPSPPPPSIIGCRRWESNPRFARGTGSDPYLAAAPIGARPDVCPGGWRDADGAPREVVGREDACVQARPS